MSPEAEASTGTHTESGMIPLECIRLAEVDFPIAVAPKHAAREMSIRHGHPSTLHLWWARRPLASSRAVLLALLLPDPCDEHCPEAFKEQAREILRAVRQPHGREPDLPGHRTEPRAGGPRRGAAGRGSVRRPGLDSTGGAAHGTWARRLPSVNPQVAPPSRTGSSMMWEVDRPAAGRALPSTHQETGVTVRERRPRYGETDETRVTAKRSGWSTPCCRRRRVAKREPRD